MVQGAAKKQSSVFKALLWCVNFFISIGEGTRIVLSSPIALWKSIARRVQLRVSAFSKVWTARARAKRTVKKHEEKTIIVSAPVAARMSAKRKKQKSQFKLPRFRFPKISFALHLTLPKMPKFQFFRINLKKKKRYTPVKLPKKKIKPRTTPRFLISLRRFSWFILKKVIRFVATFFILIWKILKTVVGFLYFLIKKPFEFLNTLFTAQLRFFLFGILICAIFFVSREFHQFVTSLPSPRTIGKVNYALATQLTDKNGKLLYEIYRDEKRTPVEISKLPKYVTEASIAIEDKDFYNHKGVSLVSGILRAGRENILKGNLQGGSTITQQLVKTSLLTPERTITRKLKEIILALWTEQMYTKSQILQMYMNQVPYGGAAYGIEEASKTYFGKNAQELTLAEAALLAGLPQAPSDYSPFVNPKLALARRSDVLQKMKEQRYITESEYEAALNTPVEVIKPEISIKAPHFVFYVKDQLEKEFGTRMVEEGGMKVTTTLDLDMQQKVEQIVEDEINKQSYLSVSNGAVIVIDPRTGEILAMVGSTDYFKEPNGAFNVTTAARQPGSSLKPLLYSLALQKGYTAASIINDSATTFNMPGAEPYRPVNYDGKFHGAVTMRMALANSYNIPAVKTLASVGILPFVNYMQNLGITTWNDPGRYVLPMSIGGVETKMVDEVSAYSALANYGKRMPLTGIKKLTDSEDKVLTELKPEGTQAMSPGAAWIISDIISDNDARAATFGRGSTLEIKGYKVAIKTGTTDSKKDNWAFGYTPEFLVGVWIGNNDNTPMSPAIESGATGASSLWHRVMEYLLKEKAQNPNQWFVQPDDIVQKFCFGKNEYFIKGTENTVNCVPTPVPTRKITGQAEQPPFQIPVTQQANDTARGNGQGEGRYNNFNAR